MKRFFSFILTASIAIASFAIELQATNAPLSKGHALKMLHQREVMEAKMMPTAKTPLQVNELDTVELTFKSFYDDPFYTPIDTIKGRDGNTYIVGGDWYLALRNDSYTFIFDFYGGKPDDPSGTYTEANLDTDGFSHAMLPNIDGMTSYYKTCNMTIKKEYLSTSIVKYTFDATVVTTQGVGGEVNGIFKLHGEHKTIEASAKYDVAILDCIIEPDYDQFRLAGKNDTMDVDMTFFTTEGVVGYYTHKMLDIDNTKFMHRGKAYEIIELEGIITNAETKTGGMAYVAMMEIIGGCETDTTFFNVAMEAPVIATDTIDITCNNLVLDASSAAESVITISADNTKYSIYAGYNDTKIKDNATYTGQNAMIYITEIATEKTINALQSTIKVKGSKAKGYEVIASALGADHKYYNIYLTNILPDQMDTINVDFPLNSKAMFKIDDLDLLSELLIANYNGEYSISFDFLHLDQIMGGEFHAEDLFIDKTEVTTYLVKHTEEGDVNVQMNQIDGVIKQKNDTTFLTATIVGLDTTVYNVSMFYALPVPTDTLSYTFTEDYTLTTNALPQGIFIFEAMTEDGLVMSNVQLNRLQSLEGTYICDGKFIENQFEPFNTFVSVLNEETGKYEEHYMQKGQMTISLKDKKIYATAEFLCDDAKLYQLTFTALYERPRLPEDATEEGVEYTYTPDAFIFIDDYVESDNVLFYEIVAADYSNVASLAFYLDKVDEEIIIPEGVYPIKDATDPITINTVNASPGLSVGGGPIQSYFAEMEMLDGDLYYKEGRGYFLVDGTVTVEKINGKLKLDVDAVNSYDLPVKLHYNASTTALDNIIAPNTNAEKCLKNGQLIIKRNGKLYNATGAQLK